MWRVLVFSGKWQKHWVASNRASCAAGVRCSAALRLRSCGVRRPGCRTRFRASLPRGICRGDFRRRRSGWVCPCWMKRSSTPCLCDHSNIARLVFSGPLSRTIASGSLRVRATACPAPEFETRIATVTSLPTNPHEGTELSLLQHPEYGFHRLSSLVEADDIGVLIDDDHGGFPSDPLTPNLRLMRPPQSGMRMVESQSRKALQASCGCSDTAK